MRRLESDVNTLNYILHTTDYERFVLSYLYDPLVDIDDRLLPIPGAATSWSVSPDGKAYTFHLDPRSTFSDGTPLRASDVLFTVRKIVDESSPQFSSFFEGLDRSSTAVIDDHTIRVAFREPRAAQIYAFNIGILPEHVYGRGDFKRDFNATAVGNGPYRLVRREAGREILLQRRDDYTRARPPIQSILFKVIADDATAWAAMKRGDLDEMRVTNDRWFYEKDRPEVKRLIDFRSFYQLQYNCIAWNSRHPLFRDAAVRRALGMCFDRKTVIEGLYHGQARAITGPFTPDQWAYDPSVPPLPHDPQAAGKLLDDAGWREKNGVRQKNGKKLAFDMLVPAGSSPSTTQSQVFQDALKAIGVETKVTPIDSAAFFDYLMAGKYEAAMVGWSADPDPDVYSLFHSKQFPPAGLNVTYTAIPEADRLIEEGRRELVLQKRAAIYHRLHRVLADDQPYTWTLQVATKWAINKRVKNVKVSSGFGLYLWSPGPMSWRLSEGQ